MSSSREGMYTPTSAMMDGRVSPPRVSAPRPNAYVAPVVLLKFTTPLSPSARVVSPSRPSNIIGQSSGVVTGIPSAPYISSPFMQNAQSGLSGSTYFVQVFPWNGGNIPPSAPYVVPLPTYVGVSSGNQNPFIGFSLHTSIQVSAAPFGSSPLSLFSGGSQLLISKLQLWL